MMEISVKDLKIGDYFANPHGFIGRIDDMRHVFSRDKDGNIEDDYYRVKLAYDEHGESYCWLDIDELRPIPIAPEILEKNGFGKLVTYGVEKWIYGDIRMNIYSSNGCWRFCADTKRNEDSVVYIHFVHELQQALRICKVDLDIVL